ncbi:MAG: cupin domain-containing protein [Candidatus Bathyarchaeota archaeon]|nr:cupin domain-containing protein [Candidatus Bathyarchaeota archaeon]
MKSKIEEMSKPWSPIEVSRVNDQVVRMALFDGEYPWHKHANEDELFYVYKGSIIIQVRGHPNIALHEGEMAVLPKGVEHSPRSLEPSYVLMFEPQSLKSQGD